MNPFDPKLPKIDPNSLPHAHCCPCAAHADSSPEGLSRRGFLQMSSLAVGTVAMAGLTWSKLAAAEPINQPVTRRRPLVVKPILFYGTASRQPMTSWRGWGGIETKPQADEEMNRIKSELEKLQSSADFPVKFQPLSAVANDSLASVEEDMKTADVVLAYAAGGNVGALHTLANSGKDVIFFVRHKSGPLYLFYEVISPITLRGYSSDKLIAKSCDESDVVVDSQEEILWRLRALCGLRNTIGSRIVALGGPGGWGIGAKAAELARDRFKLDIRTVSYDQLKTLIKEASADEAAVRRAEQQATEYLKLPGTTLETDRAFLDRAFLLTELFKRMMKEVDAMAFTIDGCMGAPMPIAHTTACMCLSLLNDAGYLAFCESDFVVIPSGILLGNISGKPVFLNDPTYPRHDGIITLAHCTAPRKMDGKTVEPARILTHFESDYGAAPKVEMRRGQVVTNIMPGFEATRWVGLLGEIVDHPFLPICRSQIDVQFKANPLQVAKRMPGFHWMTGYGDYTRELGYALRRTKIEFETLA
jgi:hypothetical protein